MLSNAQEDSRENGIISFPAERILAEGPWSTTQQRLLRAAGYCGNMAWYQAMKDERFAAVGQALGMHFWSRPTSNGVAQWISSQQKLVGDENDD